MSIAADLIRGNTDLIILAQLIHQDSYGYRINAQIRAVTDHRYELKEATLYTAVRRLEEAGYIVSYWGDEESGARRRYYSITAQGKDAYTKLWNDWQNANDIISRLITPEADQATEAL